MNNMNNKYFNDITVDQFDYFGVYPERRRACIISDKTYDINDKCTHFGIIYDAGKLNSFIKVVNDKLFLATKWSKEDEEYVAQTKDYTSFKNKSAFYLNLQTFKKLFHKGNFFNIEVFKHIIGLGIQNHGIDKIIFKRMPYMFKVDNYCAYLNSINCKYETSVHANTYTVIISCHGKTICVAMWDHSMPYH